VAHPNEKEDNEDIMMETKSERVTYLLLFLFLVFPPLRLHREKETILDHATKKSYLSISHYLLLVLDEVIPILWQTIRRRDDKLTLRIREDTNRPSTFNSLRDAIKREQK